MASVFGEEYPSHWTWDEVEAVSTLEERLAQAESNLDRRGNQLAEMQKHRDAWRGYAYGTRDKPQDFLDGNMVAGAGANRPPTFLEVNAERLAKAEAKLREFEVEWDGEKYAFTPRSSSPPYIKRYLTTE